jgi:hypothetical protein
MESAPFNIAGFFAPNTMPDASTFLKSEPFVEHFRLLNINDSNDQELLAYIRSVFQTYPDPDLHTMTDEQIANEMQSSQTIISSLNKDGVKTFLLKRYIQKCAEIMNANLGHMCNFVVYKNTAGIQFVGPTFSEIRSILQNRLILFPAISNIFAGSDLVSYLDIENLSSEIMVSLENNIANVPLTSDKAIEIVRRMITFLYQKVSASPELLREYKTQQELFLKYHKEEAFDTPEIMVICMLLTALLKPYNLTTHQSNMTVSSSVVDINFSITGIGEPTTTIFRHFAEIRRLIEVIYQFIDEAFENNMCHLHVGYTKTHNIVLAFDASELREPYMYEETAIREWLQLYNFLQSIYSTE